MEQQTNATNWLELESEWIKNMHRNHWRHQDYYEKNKEKLKQLTKRYYEKNKEKMLIWQKNWYLNNKKRYTDYLTERYHKDINFQIAVKIRNRINKIIRYNKKIPISMRYKMDYEKIIEHLKPFPENINNYHIDHIIPLSSFNLTDEEDFKKATAPENHQWLLAHDNLIKGKKIMPYIQMKGGNE